MLMKYLDQKFNNLSNKIDDLRLDTDKRQVQVENEILDLKKRVSWAETKIWVAIGGITIMTFVATYFLVTFKTLNQLQVEKAVRDAIINTR